MNFLQYSPMTWYEIFGSWAGAAACAISTGDSIRLLRVGLAEARVLEGKVHILEHFLPLKMHVEPNLARTRHLFISIYYFI